MELNTLLESGVMVAQPTANHLDAANVRAFKEAMTPVLAQNTRVVLDMSAFEFVDSAGVGALISCLRTAKEKNGELNLCELRRPVRALFDLMRMHKVFEVYNDRAEALKAMTA